MDAGIWHQVGLEFVQVDVQGTVKPQAGSNRRNNLGNQAVQVLIIGSWNVEITTADVIDSLVINKECAVGMLDGAVSR